MSAWKGDIGRKRLGTILCTAHNRKPKNRIIKSQRYVEIKKPGFDGLEEMEWTEYETNEQKYRRLAQRFLKNNVVYMK